MKTAQMLRSPLAALVPPVLLSLCVWLWAVDVLNWDEWTIWVGVLEKLQAGTLSLADLASQQNEQRNLAARLVGLALMPFFGLNRLPECAMNILLAGAGFLLTARLYARTSDAASEPAPLLPFSLLCFSLLQWETFSVGINSSVLLPPLGILAGAALAAGPPLTWVRLWLMILTGVLPSFCFVNGLFHWFCLAPVVALRADEQRLAKTAIFLLAGALAWAAYFHGYTSPAHHPSPLLSLAHPLQTAGYLLTYLGGALVGDRNLLPLATLGGAVGLWLLWLPLRAIRSRQELARLTPWLAVAAFSLFSAGATALGRSGFGMGHALESRYASFSSPLWLAIAALHSLRGGLHAQSHNAKAWARRALACCLALFLLGSALSAVVLRNRAPRLAEARAELFRLTNPQRLEAVFPDPAYVALKLPLLLDLRAGPYRSLRRLSAYHAGENAAGAFALRPEAGISGRVCGYLATGRKEGEAGGPTGQLVLFALPERLVAVGQLEADGGFALFIPSAALPQGQARLRAFILGADGASLAPLAPAEGIGLSNEPCPPPTFNVEKFFHVR